MVNLRGRVGISSGDNNVMCRQVKIRCFEKYSSTLIQEYLHVLHIFQTLSEFEPNFNEKNTATILSIFQKTTLNFQ